MASPLGTIRTLRSSLANGLITPTQIVAAALANANRNRDRNTYLWRDPAWTLAEAARVESAPQSQGGAFSDGRPVLWGLPVSVKDCFDLAGSPTTCGVTLYRDLHGIASDDSWLVHQLRGQGAVITGKTHLHPLAYGITGENPDFGDCTQPGNPNTLTGGSSSGAAASILEGSAVAAIGTDTGGSIRVPAALCGLAGYRASLDRGDWRGAAHLAPSFDTQGWLFADLEEAPLLGDILAAPSSRPLQAFTRFAAVSDSFLHDSEPAIVANYHDSMAELESLGLAKTVIDVSWWRESASIYAPIQAAEAAQIHRGHFDKFQPAIRDRLTWGAAISADELRGWRRQHEDFRARFEDEFARHELILLPATPVARLTAGADHSSTRARLLRYTTPFSLAGVPVITAPCASGGVQLASARGTDASLLQLAALWGARRKAAVAM